MTPTITLDLPDWAATDAAQQLMAALDGLGDTPKAMFVGGGVRNAVLGQAVSDVDIATQWTPDEVLAKLSAAKIKAIPTGIDHGTITAVVSGKPFEVTSLREDVATDGRRATVSFTTDWYKDSLRRDFTMNTLLMDGQGRVYDPLGSGIEDLKAGRVIFVGEASERIAEDYLRILRFFRFWAYYGQGEPDATALNACQTAAGQISTLSRERIMQEFLKILAIKNASDVLTIMFDHNVLSDLPDQKYQPDVLQKLCDLQDKFDAVDVVPRLFVLAGNRPSIFEDYFRLSHAQKKFLIKMEMAVRSPFYGDEKSLKKAIFYHGNDLLLQGYLLMMAMEKAEEDAALIFMVKSWQAPQCPITGETLMAEGYQTGPELGIELARRQDEWVEESF